MVLSSVFNPGKNQSKKVKPQKEGSKKKSKAAGRHATCRQGGWAAYNLFGPDTCLLQRVHPHACIHPHARILRARGGAGAWSFKKGTKERLTDCDKKELRNDLQIAMMTSKLNEADPTIVDGPRAPAKNRLFSTSMMDSRISGADEPRAINVRLACVVSEKKAGRQWGSIGIL